MPARRRSDRQLASDRADEQLLAHAAGYLRTLAAQESYTTSHYWITQAGYAISALLDSAARAASAGTLDRGVRADALSVATFLARDQQPPKDSGPLGSM